MKEERKSSNDGKKPSHVVAIGASAGGLEALQSLFKSIPNDLGIAYVVIQHLSPDFKSLMDELIGKITTMPAHQAKEGEQLIADNIYLIPAGKVMRIVEGTLYLSDLPPDNRINLPINEFFRSLAESEQNRSIGIILSGTGSDGSRGVQALKEVGGLVLCQDPKETQFDGMPNNAINTGSVDFILPVQEMHARIQHFISSPHKASDKNSFSEHLSENADVLDAILRLVSKRTELDFRAYKESTISRRIEHRMTILNHTNLHSYYNFIKEKPDEVDQLKQDLLIGVTQFFRDKEVWDRVITEVVDPLLLGKNEEETIRVWVAGCSTGEEAYTIAVMFLMAMSRLKITRNVKVFASDVDQSAVAFGANGVYPASIASEMPAHALASYFVQLNDGNYQVSKMLRSMVVFATHNLIQDPPFSNMDMISCRNTLIYLQNEAQQKALAFFHFALKLNGSLVLGSAETTNSLTAYFEVTDSRMRIYRKNKDIRIPLSSISSNSPIKHKGYHPKTLPQFIERNNLRIASNSRTKNLGMKHLFQRFTPASFILDHKGTILFTYGDTSKFTNKLQAGEVTNDISQVLSKEIVSHAVTIVHQVFRDNEKVTFEGVQIICDGKPELYMLEAIPFHEESDNKRYVSLSVYKQAIDSEEDKSRIYSIDEQTEKRIEELDNALLESQKLYREALEDLDTTSEELQSSNEELMAANEELQSTNEELQSVNEELYTVNGEYQQKINELTVINDDLENLFKVTKIAVLFLDKSLNVRRFTPAMREYLNLIELDIDRPIKDITQVYDIGNLNDFLDQANREETESTLEVTISDSTKVIVTATPYRKHFDNEGLVLTMQKVQTDA